MLRQNVVRTDKKSGKTNRQYSGKNTAYKRNQENDF